MDSLGPIVRFATRLRRFSAPAQATPPSGAREPSNDPSVSPGAATLPSVSPTRNHSRVDGGQDVPPPSRASSRRHAPGPAAGEPFPRVAALAELIRRAAPARDDGYAFIDGLLYVFAVACIAMGIVLLVAATTPRGVALGWANMLVGVIAAMAARI